MPMPIEAPTLATLDGVRHGFFTREGGVSEGIYASLNAGLGSRDGTEAVLENRDRIARWLGARGENVLTLFQVHSPVALLVDGPIARADLPKADALVTRTPGLVIGALAADCTPVLFADPAAGVVAAAHAGWRGALGGVLEATVARMIEAGARRDRIVAAVGPCIGPTAYEVGPEFFTAFTDADADNARYFARSSTGARPYFDLPRYVLDRLGRLGLGATETVTRCTYSEADRFFSYRRATHRNEPDYGRQISAIVVA